MAEKTVFSWTYFLNQIKSVGIIDIIDIAVVTVLLYAVYAFIRDRRAGKLALGVALIISVTILSDLIGLSALSFIMENLFQIGLIALVVVFQPELRSALEKVGGEPLKSLKNISESKDTHSLLQPYINEICRAATDLSKKKTGALIVMERSTKLGDIIKSGVTVNAEISSNMLENIFYNGAPLHDGAVVIRDWRIHAAGCFLPLSKSQNIMKDLGTRHRAAIGMSEESDAVVIVVSEETGIISIAIGGELKRGYSYTNLNQELQNTFISDTQNVGNVKKNVSKLLVQFRKDTKKDNK